MLINSSELYKLTFLRLEDLLLFCFSSFLSSAPSPWYPCKPDWDFCWFTHVPARGKKQLHACRTSIRDVIVMLKWRHHVAFQRIQDFLEAFFVLFCFQYEMQYLVVSKTKESIIRVRVGKKNTSVVITVCHDSARLLMTIRDPSNGIFLSYPHTHDGFLYYLSHGMRFYTMWYVRPAKPQISLRIHAV